MIYEISNFYNEQLVLDIKAKNNQNFVDKFYVVKSDSTYRFNEKPYILKKKFNNIVHHKLNGLNLFFKPSPQITRRFPFISLNKYSWMNEKIQRDCLLAKLKKRVHDNDIIIISDLDEILDFAFFDEIKHYLNKINIMTVKLHHTMYYFNLFEFNKNNGPPKWSYRVFIMLGSYFKKISSIEKLRILGAANKLKNEVYCPRKIMGFHHSWLLSNDNFAKIQNYSHTVNQHKALNQFFSKKINKENLDFVIKSKTNILEGSKLIINNRIKLLDSVNELRSKFQYLFL